MKLVEFRKDKFLSYSFGAGVLFILMASGLALFNFIKINNLLVLHFDNYKGIDFLGDKYDVFNVLGISILIILINFWLSIKIYFKERFLSYALSFFSSLFALLILIAVFVIISIN